MIVHKESDATCAAGRRPRRIGVPKRPARRRACGGPSQKNTQEKSTPSPLLRGARGQAGVWWPKATKEHQGEGDPAWCPRCASRESYRARSSYNCTNLNVEAVMSQYWRAPTGTSSPKAPPPGTSSQAHPDRVPPKAPPPGTSSQAHPGPAPPKAPPPGTSSQAHLEERLAALEEEMIRLRLRVAELEQHSSGAATG